MNYERIYNQIIERAKNEQEERIVRKKNGEYFEGHHIVPRCLGGTGYSNAWTNLNKRYRNTNIVGLTAREHFICHWLLIRIYPENYKLAHAFFAMCNQKNDLQKRNIISSRAYNEGRAQRKKFSYIHKGISYEERFGIDRSNEIKTKISSKLSGELNGFFGKSHSEDTKSHLREIAKTQNRKFPNRKNIKHSEKTKSKMKESAKNRKPYQLVECFVCKTKMYANVINRYHNNNCKQKINEIN
jgi:hypothetical protein